MVQSFVLTLAVACVGSLFIAGLLGKYGRFGLGYVCIVFGIFITIVLSVNRQFEVVNQQQVLLFNIVTYAPLAVIILSYLWWGVYKTEQSQFVYWVALVCFGLVIRLTYF